MHPGLGKKSCASCGRTHNGAKNHSLCTFWQVFLSWFTTTFETSSKQNNRSYILSAYEVSTSQMCSDEYFPHVNNGILKTWEHIWLIQGQLYYSGPGSFEKGQIFLISWVQSQSLNNFKMDWNKLSLLSFTKNLGHLWLFWNCFHGKNLIGFGMIAFGKKGNISVAFIWYLVALCVTASLVTIASWKSGLILSTLKMFISILSNKAVLE